MPFFPPGPEQFYNGSLDGSQIRGQAYPGRVLDLFSGNASLVVWLIAFGSTLGRGVDVASPRHSNARDSRTGSKPVFWKMLLVCSSIHRFVKEQSLRQAFDYIQKNKEPFLRDFRTLLRQPSVSAQGKGIQDCARIVKKNMDAAGIRTQI